MKSFSPEENVDDGRLLQEAESFSRCRPFPQLPRSDPQPWKVEAYDEFLGCESPNPNEY